jgi:hypothetical protein
MICQGVYSQPSPKVDGEVQQNSNNPVSGGAVFNALQAIPVPDTIAIVEQVQQNNPNAVSSGAVYTAIQAVPSGEKLVAQYLTGVLGTGADGFLVISSSAIVYGKLVHLFAHIKFPSYNSNLANEPGYVGTLVVSIPWPTNYTTGLFHIRQGDSPSPIYGEIIPTGHFQFPNQSATVASYTEYMGTITYISA